MGNEPRVAIEVWDFPVRAFHWILTLLLVFQVATGKLGGDYMKWHAYSGYTILALVIFRILWGFVGSTHARFESFLKGPAATLRFARRLFSREAVPQLGHNPLGGWMVLALIASLVLQTGSGLFANDGAGAEGPLASLVSFEVSTDLSHFHRWNLKLLIVLTCIHVGAVLFHVLVKREALVAAMFTGVKHVPAAMLHERRAAARDRPPRRLASREPGRARTASPGRALTVLAIAVAIVAALVRASH